jgi:hypothetical protein
MLSMGIQQQPQTVRTTLLGSALSPSVNLGTARRERSMLLSDDKRLLREGSDVDALSNKKGKL